MLKPIRWTIGLGCLAGLIAWGSMVVGIVSCSTAPTPFLVQGPSQLSNEKPTLNIKEPTENITRGQGDPFLLEWTDTDSDSNATIQFSLINTTDPQESPIVLVEGLDENDSTGIDAQAIGTDLIPVGTYNIQGIITDEDSSVEVFALVAGSSNQQRVVVTIVEEGSGPQTVPPIITVTAPAFNLSVAQDDELEVRVQPSALAPVNTVPFDPDSGIALYLVLDLDLDPNNDDPANPDTDPVQIIVLETRFLAEDAFQEQVFTETIDLATVPTLPDGAPYYIRITADDGTNPRVHQYAVGTINVVRLASGTVDLADIGRSLSGARLQGFNPGANVGSSVAHIQDFDADGISDFVVVAQFGNPQNVGPVGEAYLLYGRDNLRFGGTISVNTIARTVSGVIFAAPPVRQFLIPALFPETLGITDVGFIRDVTGDGRPDLLFGLPMVVGALDSTDYDPGDDPPTAQEGSPFGCYPDLIVNNFAGQQDGPPFDTYFYAGGMGVMVNSQNRDAEGIGFNVNRLESTVVNLEFAGQPGGLVLDADGFNLSGSIFPRADNDPTSNLGSDPEENGRIAGGRLIGGGYDFIDAQEPPRADLYGQQVGSVGDLNSDGFDEVVISAPRNERYINDLINTQVEGRGFSTHLFSTSFFGSIMVFPGRNYNLEIHRDRDDEQGSAVTPFLDQHNHPEGQCTSTPPAPRHYDVPLDYFEIFAEDIDDRLGDGQSAGDFNQDGLDDILCGAPSNDRSSALVDSGATYIIYGRTTFGVIDLKSADDAQLRPPMLRIRGVTPADQIGRRQTAGLDVNGDRLDDVFIGSPNADFGGVTRSTCAGDFNCDGTIDTDEHSNDLREVSFHDCLVDFGDEVFSSADEYCDELGYNCKVFDYDNDGDIDEDDRCVFCCLSGDCEPDSSCVLGLNPANCCEHLVDNGFVGIIFGGQTTNGDRDITQLGTANLAGTVFYGGQAEDRAGMDVSSAGDFNQDGFGDILITAPGETRRDSEGLMRVGVVYLVFGGTHLQNTAWSLSDPERGVGSQELPGIVFLSPYPAGRSSNEAAPITVGFIGDINNDGFGDILIGNPKADFIDLQDSDPSDTDQNSGRRSDAGEAYIVYGSNFGSNRSTP